MVRTKKKGMVHILKVEETMGTKVEHGFKKVINRIKVEIRDDT